MRPIELKAREFAYAHHGDQPYGKEAYRVHLVDVNTNVIRFGLSSKYRIASWLHDVLEDSNCAPEVLLVEFGMPVFKLVDAVSGYGKMRAERNACAYLKMRRHPDAINLKLADRIANVAYSVRWFNEDKFQKYLGEWLGFQAALRPVGGSKLMWQELDRLMSH